MPEYTTERLRYLLYSFVALLIALVVVVGINVNAPPASPSGWQPMPDPPMVDNSVHVTILSNNQVFSNNCWNCAP